MWLLSGVMACSTLSGDSPAIPAGQRVTIQHPSVRAMPPSAPNSAAFFTLENPGAATALVSVASSVSESVELHTVEHTGNGVVRMHEVPTIPVPAKGHTALEPGGYHLMLIGLRGPLEPGGEAELTLTFADGSTQRVMAPIVDPRTPHGVVE